MDYVIYRMDENLLVKVADFGLSRDVYVQDYYKTQHNVPLPVKWLAPEALFDREFNAKTDVVSIFIFVLTCQYSIIPWMLVSYTDLVYIAIHILRIHSYMLLSNIV